MRPRLFYAAEDAKTYPLKLSYADRRLLDALMKHHEMPGSVIIRLLIRDAAKKAKRKTKAPSD